MNRGGAVQNLLSHDLNWGSVSRLQKILLAKHLSVMLTSGLSIAEALKLIHTDSQGHLREVIAQIYTGVKAGGGLADNLSRYPHIFSGFFCGAVAAGEASGNLAVNLANVARQLQKDKEVVDKVRAALFYPLLVVVVAMIIGLFVAFYILPKIVPILSSLRISLPWSTRMLIVIASVVKVAGWQILLGMGVMILALVALARGQKTKIIFDRWWLSWPLIGRLLRQVNVARWSRSLAVLLQSGVSATEALGLSAQALDNDAYRLVLSQVEKAVTKGGQLAASLQNKSNYFPGMAVKMIKVGEESGRLETALKDVAEFYESELEQTSKNLAAAIEPILLIVIGLFVGALAVAIITPIYAISGGIIR